MQGGAPQVRSWLPHGWVGPVLSRIGGAMRGQARLPLGSARQRAARFDMARLGFLTAWRGRAQLGSAWR